MARLIVGHDGASSYEKPSGGALGSVPYVLWSQESGGTRYTDLLYPDNSLSGNGSVNGTAYTGGVLLTKSVSADYGAQLPDGLDVPGVWVEFDGRPERVYLEARQVDGTAPLSTQSSATAAVAAETAARQAAVALIAPTDGGRAVSALQAVAAGTPIFATQAALASLAVQVASAVDGGTPASSSTVGGINFDGGTP